MLSVEDRYRIMGLAAACFILYGLVGAFYGKTLSDDGASYLLDGEQILAKKIPDRRGHRILFQAQLAFVESLFGFSIYAARLLVVLYSVGSVLVFYLILRLSFDETRSLYGALVFASAPALVYVSPAVLSGPAGLFWGILGLYLYMLFLEEERFLFLLSSAFAFSIGFLVRETVVGFFVAVLVHLLYARRFKRAAHFSAVFCVLPLIYAVLLLWMGEPLPWLFFLGENVSSYSDNLYRIPYMLKDYLLGLGVLGVIGVCCLALVKKNYLEDDIVARSHTVLFSINLITSSALIILWPISNIRFFLILLPPIAYFTMKGLAVWSLRDWWKKVAAFTIVSGVIMGFVVGYFFIEGLRATSKATEWVAWSIPREQSIYTNSGPISVNLREKGYAVSENPESAGHLILIKTQTKVDSTKEVSDIDGFTLIQSISYMRPEHVQRIAYGLGHTINIYSRK